MAEEIFWKSLAERDGDPAFLDTLDREFVTPPGPGLFGLNRRSFLKAAGFAFSGALLSGCQRAPTRLALPQVVQPPEQTPGRPLYYATTCGECSAGCGVLAKSMDGRPIKLEGNPDHPLSRGGLCAVGQASILGLYDGKRLQHPLKNGETATWAAVDNEIRGKLEEVRRQGKTVYIISETITSPTARHCIAKFLTSFPSPRHVVFEPLSRSAILDAHFVTHGARVLPRYRLDLAKVIVSFDADFLGSWIAPVQFTASYQAGRQLNGPSASISHHVQVESRLSMTGSKADQRLCVAPGELGLVMTQLAARIARRAGLDWGAGDLESSSVPGPTLNDLAGRLWTARGKSLVLCGSQDPAHQQLCNFLNCLLQNYGATLDVERASNQSQSNDAALQEMLQDIRNGAVGALLIYRSNPIYDLPESQIVADGLRTIPLVVSFAARMDETAAMAGYVCPEPHYLETWNDSEAEDGVVSLSQPLMQPLGDTRPLLESLVSWLGQSKSAHEQIREHWHDRIHPRSSAGVSFQTFWDQALHDGFAVVESKPLNNRPLQNMAAAVEPIRTALPLPQGTIGLALYAKVAVPGGRHSYNPWLQELPDPISKVVWDNYACLSPASAAACGLHDGDVVRLEATPDANVPALELPVQIQPGQHDSVVAVALGYGSQASARFASLGPRWLQAQSTVGPHGLVGVNAAPFLAWADGHLQYAGRGVHLVKTGRRQPLACTQTHHSLNVPDALAPAGQQRRPMIQETTLAELRGESSSNHRRTELPQVEQRDLWPDDHATTGGHRWGMVVDLQACTGCSACVVACQAENNIPVVGKDEVARHREMHWLRIDRYYSSPADAAAGSPRVAFQPMMCQHCGNAPCETVCPVLATVHGSEGLNQQVYNRCVGTRYCANNCPYKVRRFNWFAYAHDDTLQNLSLNPDVTVRSRGVMEKCTFCIQRIQEVKLEARRLGIPLADGSLQTACQQSCPARAIAFGDLNDPQSTVAQLASSRRAYKVLSELNVQPSVTYLGPLRNHHDSREGGQP
jgi:molybdopterin-containing oxidoreductase family iron-sulfur binding subunit